MKVLLILLLALSGPLLAAGPQLLVRGARGEDAPLHIEEIAIDVTIAGDMAETTILVGFRNKTSRRLEGDFVMPLPEGATVSSYALDVNGHMRQGVAVEKERARFAYESIKRQMIDPGFVEREVGNVYRTKIFPIMPNAVKRVQLGYVEHLNTVDSKFRYTLPCQFDVPVAKFSCKIRGSGGNQIRVTDSIGLMFTETPSGELSVRATNQKINGTLGVTVSAPRKPALIVEDSDDGGDRFFYLTEFAPESAVVPARRQPKSVLLVWDASESRKLEATELAELDAWFRQLGNIEVRLQVLRNTIGEIGVFKVRDGNWSLLKAALENTYHDGATALDRLRLDDVREDVIVLCSDGISPFGLPAGAPAKPLFILNGSGAPTPRPWASLARRSGGATIDLGPDSPDRVIQTLTNHTLGIVSITGSGAHSCHFPHAVTPGEPVRIYGRLHPDAGGTLKVNFGYGDTILNTRTFTIDTERAAKGGIIRRAWAQAALRHLESDPAPSKAKIIAHCRTYGLVSDHTSLIVLERFEDHVRYEIPPPEEDLLVRYKAAVRDKKARNSAQGTNRLIHPWHAKRTWHKRTFPWMEIALLPRLEQVGIWSKAVSTVFRQEDLDQQAFKTIDNWRREALEVVYRREKLTNAADLAEWEKEIGKLVASGAKLRTTPLQSPSKDQPLVVSVRGLVKKPGNVSGTPGMTLKQAITKAGDIHALGSETNVELYRNAGKTIYNMASVQFKDLLLKPGDMIVVGQPYQTENDWGDVDPFAPDAGREQKNPSQEPAVVEDTDVWVSGGSADGDPFAGASGGGASPDFLNNIDANPEAAADLVASIRVHRTEDAAPPAFQAFEMALKNKKASPHAAYKALRGPGPQEPDFYVNAARILCAHGHPELAEQVLSNFLETPEPDLGRFLTNVMWLVEFQRTTAAVTLLDYPRRLMPAEVLTSYHRAMIDQQREDDHVLARNLDQVIQQGRPSQSLIALTDFNGLVARNKITRPVSFPTNLMDNFDADIRIVVMGSNLDHSLGLSVAEPNGSTCFYQSPCGGRIAHATGISEYMIRRAMPGRYKIQCRSAYAMTVRAILYRNWGRPNQTSKTITMLLPGDRKNTTIAEYDFEFEE